LGVQLREAGRPRFDLGDLPRDGLVSEEWGADRGKAIDRRYIEAFLRRHEGDVRGRCLEIKEPAYTTWFGGEKVTACDVLDIDHGNREANVHGDLSQGAGIPDSQYDCFILTQTLHLLYDFRGALFHAVRVLRPGGTLLVSVPAVARVLPGDAGIDTDYWRFTEASLRRLFAELLPLDAFEVSVYGNATAAAAFLYGLAAEDLEPGELERVDPHFPVIVAVRARKPA
jgi:SAM-dependent methyltransferase